MKVRVKCRTGGNATCHTNINEMPAPVVVERHQQYRQNTKWSLVGLLINTVNNVNQLEQHELVHIKCLWTSIYVCALMSLVICTGEVSEMNDSIYTDHHE